MECCKEAYIALIVQHRSLWLGPWVRWTLMHTLCIHVRKHTIPPPPLCKWSELSGGKGLGLRICRYCKSFGIDFVPSLQHLDQQVPGTPPPSLWAGVPSLPVHNGQPLLWRLSLCEQGQPDRMQPQSLPSRRAVSKPAHSQVPVPRSYHFPYWGSRVGAEGKAWYKGRRFRDRVCWRSVRHRDV